MFRTVSDFLNSWKYESEATLKCFRELTEASLAQQVTPDGRTLGFLAWHITTAIGDIAGAAGLPLHIATSDQPVPATPSEIAAVYEKAALAVADAVKANWPDSQLSDEIPMYGETWTKGFTLGCLVAHQCHHRGQMTVLMRQAGLKVPGIYGPAKEEWAAIGMAAQA
jgi:uncharacterized damage-inducible protein DinB